MQSAVTPASALEQKATEAVGHQNSHVITSTCKALAAISELSRLGHTVLAVMIRDSAAVLSLEWDEELEAIIDPVVGEVREQHGESTIIKKTMMFMGVKCEWIGR